MSKNKFTKREKQIMSSMGLDSDTTKFISEIGRISGTHKYDVWIGREISKNNELISRRQDFQYIIDWAKKDRPNIFSFSFEEAYQKSKNWHEELAKNSKFIVLNEEIDKERVIYVSNNKKYFFIVLNPNELDIEGDIMKNCVASYKQKVILGNCIIISMRDMKNQPHVTIEVDVKTNTVVQIRGKANQVPNNEYMKIITEFALYASGFEEELDEEIINLINLNFN